MAAFPELWKNFIFKMKMEFVSVLYIGLLFHFNSIYPTTDKWIIGMNSLVVQSLILLIYKKRKFFGEKEK
ncbi:hypothetical protein VNO78_35288 [Psophocarpus tetragonolobus]|uniref:Uncharacterized protein n=1 Tax=Psophocarpus tetragonolobus TaxID=3891 RepID=A0AAN9NN91_PSOTE